MIRFSMALVGGLFLGTSAFAATTVVEFTPTEPPEEGPATLTLEFIQGDEPGAGTTRVRGGDDDGGEGTYVSNSETGQLCGTDPEGVETCVQFDNPTGEPAQAGDTDTYSVTSGENAGATGTATVLEVIE